MGKAVTSEVPHIPSRKAEGPATPFACALLSIPIPCRAIGGQGWEREVGTGLEMNFNTLCVTKVTLFMLVIVVVSFLCS